MSENENAAVESSDDNNSGFIPPKLPDTKSDFRPPSLSENSDTDGTPTSSSLDPNTSAIESARAEIEAKLSEASSVGASSFSKARNVNNPGIVGVGVSNTISAFPNKLVIYVENKANEEEVRREMFDTISVKTASDDSLPVEIEVTGTVRAYASNKSKHRPAPAGASAGHHQITAGTIGGWARGNGDRANRLLMLSNNHVLANSNQSQFGDSIIQPGKADDGVNTRDRIATLERFVTINFGSQPNYVDCATGWCWPDMVRRDHVFHRGGNPTHFRIGNSVSQPQVDMIVGKSGRTTDLTQGSIRATNVSINVNFGDGQVAHFRDQFSVRSTGSNDFSQGGDSGSIVWEWNNRLSPIGLLFAGGGGTTFCNRISRVLTALDISLAEN